jgi:hypothetical protein
VSALVTNNGILAESEHFSVWLRVTISTPTKIVRLRTDSGIEGVHPEKKVHSRNVILQDDVSMGDLSLGADGRGS